ncbi:acyl transferase/acyl hydrolase/lysophospholipase [Holotrichia oblita]|uniref:Acyl transferase/acyl hydrolase/lysophospholipase n=1 Tax=Holotrichia oblita TaxID=644536 RepID=A0ACB9T9A4_HOLOL|nr:acyl transferase/acyl hydrolase/lysophospholipase [Holotrichia oblita]
MAACAVAGGIVTAACVAGHSLGEYAALCHAGAFGLEDGFKIISACRSMANGETREGCAMYAIIGSDEASVVAACEKGEWLRCPRQL